MATFTYKPDKSAAGSNAPRIRKAQFGDGYEQRALDGLNPDLAKWSLSFTGRSQADAFAIRDFFIAQGGVTAFDWTAPDGRTGKWVCDSWKVQAVDYTVWAVSAEFRQVPK